MAAMYPNYYETLGVERNATPDEIKKAFRTLARLYHPDVATDKFAGEANFREINEAYEVLSDEDKRKRFDEIGAQGVDDARESAAQDASGFEGTGFSDFFERYFSGRHDGFGAPSGYGAGFKQRGRDLEADILVTLEEALHGSTRRVSRPAEAGGRGETGDYQVQIPPGARDGLRLRLSGRGQPGYGGAPMGDLYLRVRFARHPDFTVNGTDLYCDLDLAPWEAVLGVKVTISKLDGSVVLKVKPGTAAGTHIRLRGFGLPNAGGGRGDIYATIRIQIPTVTTADEQALWSQLATLSTFRPRSPV